MTASLSLLALCPQTPHNREGGGGAVRSFFVLSAVAQSHDLTLAVLDSGREVPAPLASRCLAILRPELTSPLGSPQARRRSLWQRVAGTACGDDQTLLTTAERNCVSRAEGTSQEQRGVIRRLGHTLYAWSLLIAVELRVALFGMRPARGSERVAFYEAVVNQIEAAHRRHPFTHLWVEHSYLIPEALDLSRRLGGLPLILDAHNVESVLHARFGRLMTSITARAWYRGQARQLRRIEADGFRRADQVLCCSEADAHFIRELAPDARIEVIPNGVDTDYMHLVGSEAAQPTLAFVGSFGYFPNVDAVTYFHAEILPLIWQEVPDCRFSIIGYGAERFAPLADRDPRIQIAANVPDIRPDLSQAWAVVVPLRTGSGTRLKILDAMAMGKAVISTPIGAEGIDLESQGAGIIAAEVSEFAAQTVRLLTDRQRREVMGLRGSVLAEKVFSWRVVGAKLKELNPILATRAKVSPTPWPAS